MPRTPRYFDMFRFQTGSIKREPACNCHHEIEDSFDSKLVRLKGLAKGQPYGTPQEFRFQTGSIKRDFSIPRTRARKNVSIPNWFD